MCEEMLCIEWPSPGTRRQFRSQNNTKMSGSRFVFIYFSKALSLCSRGSWNPNALSSRLSFLEVVIRKKKHVTLRVKIATPFLIYAASRRHIFCTMRARSNARTDSKTSGNNEYFGWFFVAELGTLGPSLALKHIRTCCFRRLGFRIVRWEEYCDHGGFVAASRQGRPGKTHAIPKAHDWTSWEAKKYEGVPFFFDRFVHILMS